MPLVRGLRMHLVAVLGLLLVLLLSLPLPLPSIASFACAALLLQLVDAIRPVYVSPRRPRWIALVSCCCCCPAHMIWTRNCLLPLFPTLACSSGYSTRNTSAPVICFSCLPLSALPWKSRKMIVLLLGVAAVCWHSECIHRRGEWRAPWQRRAVGTFKI